MKNKKAFFTVGQIPTLIMLIAMGILVLGFVLQITGTVRDDIVADNLAASCGLNSTGGTGGTILYTACPDSYDGAVNGITGLGNIAAKWGTIGTLVAVGVIIGLLFGVFPTGKGR